MEKPIVRIAPSPTGKLHIGTARTALFNYLFAKKNKGKYLLRIEDTDAKRSKPEFEVDILDSLKWLGLQSDEQPERQTHRLAIYKKYAQKLFKEKKAYYCFCSPEELEDERRKQIARKQPPRYSGKCCHLKQEEIDALQKEGRKPALRLKIPDTRGTIKFNDLIRGEIKEKAALIGDFVIMKSDGIPLFFFAGVIDDHEQSITHVVRGEDHISNTFSQILICEALGWENKMPKFAHLPMILNTDRSKMSKRKGDFVSVAEYKEKGYLPQAMINFMALLGWHPRKSGKNGEEIYSLKELGSLFELSEVGKSPAIFDKAKLDYINGFYLRKLSDEKLKSLIVPSHLGEGWQKSDVKIDKVISLVKDRLKTLSDFAELADYFFEKPVYDKEILIFKKSSDELTQKGLTNAIKELIGLNEDGWEDQQKIQKALLNVVAKEKLNNGDVFWPVRAALSGREASPSPVELLWALGKNESLNRLTEAQELINK
jgi:glutamyl-tRNA synthetase